jgi:hypothetical protein
MSRYHLVFAWYEDSKWGYAHTNCTQEPKLFKIIGDKIYFQGKHDVLCQAIRS